MTEAKGITKDNYSKFKKMYQQAVKENKEQFVFEGQDVLTAYAKYACEYMENKLKGGS